MGPRPASGANVTGSALRNRSLRAWKLRWMQLFLSSLYGWRSSSLLIRNFWKTRNFVAPRNDRVERPLRRSGWQQWSRCRWWRRWLLRRTLYRRRLAFAPARLHVQRRRHARRQRIATVWAFARLRLPSELNFVTRPKLIGVTLFEIFRGLVLVRLDLSKVTCNNPFEFESFTTLPLANTISDCDVMSRGIGH